MTAHPTGYGSTVIEAELRLPAATVQVWQFDLVKPLQTVLRDEGVYRLDMCLSPRLPGSGLCFADHWAAHRFERPGRIFMIPPGETLRVRGGVGHQGAIICFLPKTRLGAWLEDDLAWTDRRLEASLDIASVSVGNLLLQLGEEARHPGFASEILSEAIAVQIAVHLQRYYRGFTESQSSGGLTPWRLRLIEERLKDVQHAPTLTELATPVPAFGAPAFTRISREPRHLHRRICGSAPDRNRKTRAIRAWEREIGRFHTRFRFVLELLLRVPQGYRDGAERISRSAARDGLNKESKIRLGY